METTAFLLTKKAQDVTTEIMLLLGGNRMKRCTVKKEQQYTTQDVAQALEQLGRLEDMYDALCAELQHTVQQMQTLSAQGKTKSATYRQLFANKLTLQGLISRFDVYGL